MINVSTTILGTDFSPANAKRAMRAAEDLALKFHRRRYMPLHFNKVARHRYHVDYLKQPGKYTRKSQSSRKKGSERSRIDKQRREMSFDPSASDFTFRVPEIVRDPLVNSGLTRLKVLKGGVNITGRFDKRGITYNVPFYIKINPAGQINKVRALNAIINQEERKLSEIIEKKFPKELNKKTVRKTR